MGIFELIILIVLLLISINSLYLFWVYYKKAKEVSDYLRLLFSYILFVYEKMKQFDKREMFSKDDEVGVLFEEMKKIIYTFNDILNLEEQNGSQEKK